MTTDGYAIAERLGLDAFHGMDGDDGAAYLLEDGRVLKLTSSPSEAALALALTDLQARGVSHPGVPRVHDLRRFVDTIDLSEIGGVRTLVRYAIVRDGFDDPFTETDDHAWADAVAWLAHGWRTSTPASIDQARLLCGTSAIDEVLDALRWIEARTGVRLGDIRPSNIGVSPSGVHGMRDLGRGRFPPEMLGRLDAADLPDVPEPTPAPRA